MSEPTPLEELAAFVEMSKDWPEGPDLMETSRKMREAYAGLFATPKPEDVPEDDSEPWKVRALLTDWHPRWRYTLRHLRGMLDE